MHALLRGHKMRRWPQVGPEKLSRLVWWKGIDWRARQTWASLLTDCVTSSQLHPEPDNRVEKAGAVAHYYRTCLTCVKS
jgi:hypothetical protein